MSVSHGWLGRYKDIFRALGKRPTVLERKVRTAERHRLLVPTRIAVAVAAVVFAYFLVWPMIRSITGS